MFIDLGGCPNIRGVFSNQECVIWRRAVHDLEVCSLILSAYTYMMIWRCGLLCSVSKNVRVRMS